MGASNASAFPVDHVARCWAPHRRRFVYFAERGGFLKIGTSNDVPARMRAFGATLLAITPGSFQEERAMHRRFAEYGIGHEWFVDAPAIRDVIASLPVPLIPLPPAAEDECSVYTMAEAAGLLGLALAEAKALALQDAFPVRVLKIGAHFRHWRVYKPTLHEYLTDTGQPIQSVAS